MSANRRIDRWLSVVVLLCLSWMVFRFARGVLRALAHIVRSIDLQTFAERVSQLKPGPFKFPYIAAYFCAFGLALLAAISATCWSIWIAFGRPSAPTERKRTSQ
jgi:hypothetical protein